MNKREPQLSRCWKCHNMTAEAYLSLDPAHVGIVCPDCKKKIEAGDNN